MANNHKKRAKVFFKKLSNNVTRDIFPQYKTLCNPQVEYVFDQIRSQSNANKATFTELFADGLSPVGRRNS